MRGGGSCKADAPRAKRFSLSVSWHRSSFFVPPRRSLAIETKEYDLVMAEFSADGKFPASGLKSAGTVIRRTRATRH
jgi:hypothetical protein